MTRPASIRMTTCLLLALTLLLAACGGDDGGTADLATTTRADPATEPTVAENEPEEITQTTEESSESGLQATETMAVVTIGGETFNFAIVDDGGSCNPDLFGVYRALLTRVDDDGEPVEWPDQPGFTEGIDIVVPHEGEAQMVILGYFDGMEWSAGEDGNDESSIDSATVDGTRAEGTATFVNESGETAEGTFEVVCVEGSISASGEGGDFCDRVAGSLAMDEDVSLSDPDIERIMAQAIGEFDDLRSQAPKGIADDVDTLYQALLLIDETLAAHGYDLAAVPEEEMERLADPVIEDAEQRLHEYCGLD